MENEKVNLLVSEDELLPENNNELNNNLEEDQYTEELDFSGISEETNENQEMVEEVPTVDSYIPENIDEDLTSVPINPVLLEPVYEDGVLEHPTAKIDLGKTDEETNIETEVIETGELKKSLFENKTLLYVLLLGLVLLLAIFIVPYFI